MPAMLDRCVERWWSLLPRARQLLAIALIGTLVAASLARTVASPYGPPVSVLVAEHDLPVGHVVTGGDVRATRHPTSVVPADALRPVDQALAVGRTVTASMLAGAVVTRRHLGDLGLAEALPDGRVGVPVPLGALPDLQVGSRITVVAHELDGRATELSSHALVVGRDEHRVWLAVEPVHGPRIAAAAASGRLTAVVHGR